MLTEMAGILGRVVHLIVVGTGGGTCEVRAIGIAVCHHVVLVDIVVDVLVAHRSVEVVATAKAVRHRVNGIVGAVFVTLIGVDTLAVREPHRETFEDLAPSEVVAQSGLHVEVRTHIALVVTVVLQQVVVVTLVLTLLRVADTIIGDIIVADLLRDITGTGEQQCIVLLRVGASDLDERLVLCTVVATDAEVSTEKTADLHIEARTVVPTAVVETPEVTTLLEVAQSTEVVDVVRGATDVDAVFLLDSSLPVFVEEVIVEVFHGLKLIGLVETVLDVERRVRRIGCSYGVVHPPILVGTQHLRTCHLIGQTEGATVGDTGCSEFPFFCRHKDDTVGSTGTIDSGSGILQYGDALHL